MSPLQHVVVDPDTRMSMEVSMHSLLHDLVMIFLPRTFETVLRHYKEVEVKRPRAFISLALIVHLHNNPDRDNLGQDHCMDILSCKLHKSSISMQIRL